MVSISIEVNSVELYIAEIGKQIITVLEGLLGPRFMISKRIYLFAEMFEHKIRR